MITFLLLRLCMIEEFIYISDFIPDVVTIGKPMGNGHPVAALVTTRQVADRFKLPYFNTVSVHTVSLTL